MAQPHFSQEGFESLKTEYASLKESRKGAVSELAKARDMGDLKENGYYKSARMKVNDIDRRIRELDYLIKNARVYTHVLSTKIALGSVITLSDGNKDITYTLVGAYEANPSEGKISDVSPLGRLLLGKAVNDNVELSVPAGVITYTVKKIA